jgi:hypothetical protein
MATRTYRNDDENQYKSICYATNLLVVCFCPMYFAVNPAANATVTGHAVIIRPQILNET